MKKLLIPLILLCLMSCQTIKNGVTEPKTPQQTSVDTHYECTLVKSDLQIYFVKAIPDTTKQLPVTIRTYTTPVPTKK